MAKSETKTANPKFPKYFEDQFDDEEVLYVFRKHPIVMRKGLVLGMLGPLLGIIPAAIWPELGFAAFFGGLALGCLLGVLVFTPSWIDWHFSVFILTDQRFIQITQKGMFHRAVSDLALAQVQSVNYEVSGLQETMLGFGTIKMQTYVGDLTIHDLHHPAKIQKRLVNVLRERGYTVNKNPTVNYDSDNQPTEVDEETQEAEEA